MRIAFFFRFAGIAAFFAAAVISIAGDAAAQQVPEQVFSEMKWNVPMKICLATLLLRPWLIYSLKREGYSEGSFSFDAELEREPRTRTGG